MVPVTAFARAANLTNANGSLSGTANANNNTIIPFNGYASGHVCGNNNIVYGTKSDGQVERNRLLRYHQGYQGNNVLHGYDGIDRCMAVIEMTGLTGGKGCTSYNSGCEVKRRYYTMDTMIT